MANVRDFQERLTRAEKAGTLPPRVEPRALAGYLAAVGQGMSQQARDGASAAEMERVAELAMTAWPVPKGAVAASGERRRKAGRPAETPEKGNPPSSGGGGRDTVITQEQGPSDTVFRPCPVGLSDRK